MTTNVLIGKPKLVFTDGVGNKLYARAVIKNNKKSIQFQGFGFRGNATNQSDTMKLMKASGINPAKRKK